MRFARGGAALAVVLAGAQSCREPTATLPSVADFITRVVLASDTSIKGVLVEGQPPAGSSGGLTVVAPPVVINGGSAQIHVSAGGATFTSVAVYVAGRPDYYLLTLPSAQTEADLILTMSVRIPAGAFQWFFGVGASATSVGSYTGLTATVVRVLSGDVQVSISWDANSDVDLHVVEPSAEEVYYANTSSATGGVLDLDSNADCVIDGVRNENITWPDVTPPSGTYTVRVDYYKSCSVSQTNYVVTILVKGHAPQTFTGSFTGTGDLGGALSGVTIGTFTFP